jgi:membrane-associated protease RseP (regulator of RpoE activity)
VVAFFMAAALVVFVALALAFAHLWPRIGKGRGRLALVVAATIAAMGLGFLLLLVGHVIGGEFRLDTASMAMTVGTGCSGAKAGLVDGDRLMTIAGQMPGDWNDVGRIFGEHAGASVPVAIERDGKPLTIPVTVPPANVREMNGIGVAPWFSPVSLTPWKAFKHAVLAPLRTGKRAAKGALHLARDGRVIEWLGPLGVLDTAPAVAAGDLGAADAMKLAGLVGVFAAFPCALLATLVARRRVV